MKLINKSKLHELKTLSTFYSDIVLGQKKFEIRKNDRNFKIGDILYLREINDDKEYTGYSCLVVVTYLVSDPSYCKEGFVVMGITLLEKCLKDDFYKYLYMFRE